MPTKFATLSNNIFKYLVFFCLSFLWLSYYKIPLLVNTICSIITTCIICFILTFITNKKTLKKNIKLNQINQIKETIINLAFLTTNEINSIINNALKNLSYNPQISNYCIYVNNTAIFHCFNKTLTPDILILFYQMFESTNKDYCLILTNKIDDNVNNLMAEIDLTNVKILDGNQTYLQIIEPSKITIANKIQLKKSSKLSFSKLLCVMFNKSQTKPYFLSGLALLFASLFYPYSTYYTIVATILFMFSLFSFYNKNFNQSTNENLFK